MAVVYIVQWLQGVGDFFSSLQSQKLHCILFLKLFWPIVRRNCSSDQEKLLEFKVEGRELAQILDLWNNLFQKWKVRTIVGNWRFLRSNK